MYEIEISEDINHQKLSWQIKKIGIAVIFILVIVSSLGFFGSGLLSSVSIDDKTAGVKINYERFLRAGSNSEFLIKLEKPEYPLSISLNNKLIENITLDQITPEPSDQSSSQEFTSFTFQKTGGGVFLIKISFTSEYPKIMESRMKINESEYSFTQVVYP